MRSEPLGSRCKPTSHPLGEQLMPQGLIWTWTEWTVMLRCSPFLPTWQVLCSLSDKKSKVAADSIMSIRHWADPHFLAVSLQVTLLINPVVGCRYFSPDPRLLSQPMRSHPWPVPNYTVSERKLWQMCYSLWVGYVNVWILTMHVNVIVGLMSTCFSGSPPSL